MSENVLTTPDLIVFFGSLAAVLAIGLWASRREETSEDFFLAGRNTPWWGVAGSIFGSNVSANHMVGMMGIGFSVGFAQAHFELGAIVGLMLLCYGFLPVYRRLKVYTLSHYLGARYDERSRLSYSLIMVVLMAVIQMVPALYIGSRSVCVLLGGDAVSRVAVTTPAETRGPAGSTLPAETEGSPSGQEQSRQGRAKLNVNPFYYAFFVIALAAVSASYTIWGGLKAVIWTDVIQSVLLLGAGILLAFLTFNQIGGWDSMMALDRAGAGKMHLYLPASHPELPWTGVLTGLMALHCFYWGTNQFIVQRTLSARSDLEARWGIVVAGFLKMLIPFFAIGTGVAAFYLFQTRLPDRTIAPDTAFTELVKLVIPLGTGVVGLIMAGVIGAILSSIDSMMNSAATLVAVDVYKRHLNPKADERRMILVGRLCILFFVVLAALMAIFVLDPNSEENFFLQIVQYGSYLMPGLLVAFLMGIFWRRSTPAAGFATILGGIFYSWLVEFAYNSYHVSHPGVSHTFGSELNFFHRVVLVILLCGATQVLVSWTSRRDPDKEKLVWTDLTGHTSRDLSRIACGLLVSIAWFALLGWWVYRETLSPVAAAWLGAAWTLALFWVGMGKGKGVQAGFQGLVGKLRDDRFWAGVLCAAAVFLMYVFF